MVLNFLGFFACVVIIFLAGRKLTFYGVILSEITGLGKAWIGLILMAAVTSLPELMVGFSSASIIQSADLAVGDILGSCAFNLGLLSLMDIFTTKQSPLFRNVSQNHILAASFGLILVAFAGLGLFLKEDIVIAPSLGLTSISFALIYFLSIRTIYKFQKVNTIGYLSPKVNNDWPLNKVVIRYSLFALIIILSASTLPFFAERIAEHTGLSQSFVGMLFLAISTSLPEVSVSISAVRSGSADMAVGNLLGSNIFNIFILFLDDVFYVKGHILKDASDSNIVSVFFVILMTTVAIIGFMYPRTEKKLFMAWDTFVIFLLYVFNMTILYYLQ